MFRAGRANKPVTIQEATLARDSHGQPVETWSTFHSWRCEISPLRGQERFAAQQLEAQTSHKLTGHYISGVRPSMRVVYDGRTFRIESVINQGEQGRVLELECVEILEA